MLLLVVIQFIWVNRRTLCKAFWLKICKCGEIMFILSFIHNKHYSNFFFINKDSFNPHRSLITLVLFPSILQMRKPRQREIKLLSQGQSPPKWWTWYLSPGRSSNSLPSKPLRTLPLLLGDFEMTQSYRTPIWRLIPFLVSRNNPVYVFFLFRFFLSFFFLIISKRNWVNTSGLSCSAHGWTVLGIWLFLCSWNQALLLLYFWGNFSFHIPFP